MKKTTLFILTIALSLAFSAQIFGQAQRDIAVVGHNLNHPAALAAAAPNSTFGGWAGGAATFQVFTNTPPQSFLKNKINGVQLVGCNATLNLVNIPAAIDFDPWGSADLFFNGVGNFNVACGGTILTGTFNRAILHVSNGSNSASITLLTNSVTYVAPTNLITNFAGNFAWTNGSLSIGMITDQPVVVNPAIPSIGNFRAYSNIVFGARKI